MMNTAAIPTGTPHHPAPPSRRTVPSHGRSDLGRTRPPPRDPANPPSCGTCLDRDTPPEYLDDIELVARLRSGDMEALGALFARHRGCILAAARRLIDPVTAEDMASETVERFLAAVRHGHGPTENVCAYLRRTAHSCVIDYLRRRRDLPEQHLDDRILAPDHTDRILDGIQLREALARLPRRWQVALWATYGLGVGRTELGDLLHVKPQAAVQLLYRARLGLRKAFTELAEPSSRSRRFRRTRANPPDDPG